jgi:hypothetical protein
VRPLHLPAPWRRWDAWAVLAGWLGLSGFLLWQATLSAPLLWEDSKSYEQVGSLPLWSAGFWFGQRPPLVPFLWKVTGSPTAFVVVQTVIAALCWGYLVLTVGRAVPQGLRRVFASFAVLAFASTLPLTMWNRSVLSETLSLSAVALLFAVAIRLAERPTRRRVIALVAVALWAGTARDSGIAVALLLALVALYLLIRGRHDRRLAALGAVGLVLVVAFCAISVSVSGRTEQNVDDVLYVRVFPYPARVAWFADHGMPQSGLVDQLARLEARHPGTGAPVVAPDLSSKQFAPLERWVDSDASDTYGLWAVTHPWFVVSEPLVAPTRAYNFADGDLYFYAGTDPVRSGLEPVLWPAWPWLLLVSVAVIVAASLRRMWGDPRLRATLVLAVLGIPVMLIAWHSDGQEVTRHTIEGLAQVRLGVLLALILAVVGARPPTAPEQPAPSVGIREGDLREDRAEELALVPPTGRSEDPSPPSPPSTDPEPSRRVVSS